MGIFCRMKEQTIWPWLCSASPHWRPMKSTAGSVPPTLIVRRRSHTRRLRAASCGTIAVSCDRCCRSTSPDRRRVLRQSILSARSTTRTDDTPPVMCAPESATDKCWREADGCDRALHFYSAATDRDQAAESQVCQTYHAMYTFTTSNTAAGTVSRRESRTRSRVATPSSMSSARPTALRS